MKTPTLPSSSERHAQCSMPSAQAIRKVGAVRSPAVELRKSKIPLGPSPSPRQRDERVGESRPLPQLNGNGAEVGGVLGLIFIVA
jgi:hypothetical protein